MRVHVLKRTLLFTLLALFALSGGGSGQAPTQDLHWANRDGIWVFNIHFDHAPDLETTDQHVEMGYYYVDCFGERGPAAQGDWPFKAPLINHVRRIYYADQKVLRYIFYVPRAGGARIDHSMADANTCVVTISPLAPGALPRVTPAAPAGEAPARKMVVIDPGHGGLPSDPYVQVGARTARRFNGQYYYEKDLTLKIANYLENYIKQSPNLACFMTRREDKYLALDRRVELANEARGDLFLSIHLNATGGRRKTRGFEIFYLANEERAVNRELAAMENEEKAHLDQKDSSGETLRELLKMLADEKFPQVQAESRNLCTVINDEFAHAGPFKGHIRGVKSEALRVLLNFNMPSALAECGFIDDDAEARQLIQPKVQQQIAALLYNGINRYFALVDSKFQPHTVQVGP